MTSAERNNMAVATAVLAALTAFVLLRFEVSTDILAFLPSSADREAAELSRQIASSELSRTMVVTIEAADTERAVEAGRAFEEALRADDDASRALASIEGGPPVGVEEAIWALYHPRRFGFIGETVEEAASMTTADGLGAAAAELRRRLESPMSALVTRVAPGDPLLAMPRLFERMERRHGAGLAVIDGRFVTADRLHAVLLLTSVDSAFDSASQAPLLAAIQRAFEHADEQLGGGLVLEQSGINRFAVRTEAAIKADIKRVSTLSLLGLAMLLVVVFRSPRLVAIASIPVGAGVLSGCAVTLALFGRIHGVTLAFGASLIGVSIDYVVHLYCHHAVHPDPQGPAGTLRHIWKALRTGALTTLVGFVALGWARFPGLVEVAVFAVVGIGSALATTRFVLPPLIPNVIRPVPARDRLVAVLQAWLRTLNTRRRFLAVFAAIAAVYGVAGASRVRWNDDFGSMTQLDPELVAEDDRVRERVAPVEQTRFVVSIGDDTEAALQTNDEVALALEQATSSGEIGGFRSAFDLVPSGARQSAVDAVLRSDDGLWERFEQVFSSAGYRPSAFAEFRDALDEPAPTPVSYDDVMESPLAPMVRGFRVHMAERVGVVTFLEDVRDPTALAARVSAIDGAVFLDQSALVRDANRMYLRGTAEALILGLLAVLIVLAARYREFRRTAAAFVPSVLASLVTIATLAFTGNGLDLVGLTALLMVVSMGVDYGVFLVDAHDGAGDDLGAALLSVAVACLTTVFGFGTLALSAHPVLHVIGLTAAIGVVSSVILAPVALVLLARSPV